MVCILLFIIYDLNHNTVNGGGRAEALLTPLGTLGRLSVNVSLKLIKGYKILVVTPKQQFNFEVCIY